MRLRRHSGSSPSIARPLIANSSLLSILTSALSKGSKSNQTSFPSSPSVSSIPVLVNDPSESPKKPAVKPSEEDPPVKRGRRRSFSIGIIRPGESPKKPVVKSFEEDPPVKRGRRRSFSLDIIPPSESPKKPVVKSSDENPPEKRGRRRSFSLAIDIIRHGESPTKPVVNSSEEDPPEKRGRRRSFSFAIGIIRPGESPKRPVAVVKSSEEDPPEKRGQRPVSIDTLPDHILLIVFDFYRASSTTSNGHTAYTWPWKRLVHVCQKWRRLVFASPDRLNLRLFCDSRTPARKSLEYWPSLPIIIRSTLTSTMFTLHDRENGENIVAALEQRDRVCKVELKNLTSYLLNSFTEVMQEPFPELTGIFLSSHIDAEPVLPDKFLGSFVPKLQYFDLDGISFSALPKLLSSATHLNRLQLRRIPCTGYISPEAMAACLAALSNLEFLVLEFHSPQSRPTRDNRPSSPNARATLPALTSFDFQGVSEYLEVLVTHIDAPLLNRVAFKFFNQLTFDNPQLSRFIDRTEILKSLNLGSIEFLSDVVKTTFTSPVGRGKLELGISCCRPDWQVSSMAQLCAQLPGLTSRVEQLDVRKGCISRAKWPEDMESAQWLELFDPFIAVERLSILKLGQLVVPALGELRGEKATNILPAMRTLLFRGLEAKSLIKDDLKPFVFARRSSNLPISVLWGLK